MLKKCSLTLLLVVAAALSVAGQGTQTAPAPFEGKLKSTLMAREMPYRVILPADYSTKPEARFPVVYLLHGLSGHFDNWTDRTKLKEYARAYELIIVTPEGGDGWYTDSVSSPTEKYESYIVQELIPEVEKKFRTLTTRDKRAIAGLSMGGYGSLKFGLKYPDKFVLAGSFSGALGAASFSEKTAGAIGKSIDLIYGPLDGETRKANDIFRIVKGLSPEKIKALPFLYIDCGTEDFLFQNNREYVQLLVEMKIPHEYRELPGVHDWKYWDKQVQEFLRVADRTFGSK
ncbi:MAG: esterase family protein [Acidobacteria bacterium]|nr:esterase family protein [Acidobacteriota bacterium]